jgi:ubiquinone/menaquinone biosynthesis C-methylase UbiE
MSSATTIEKAMLYEKYRLPYAEEMVGALRERIGKVEVIADIGAGTGQLARMFADGSTKIYAVEPDPAMREVATLSLENFSQIEVVARCAEETTLVTNSIDLIVVGNAFHRFKPEACGELRRILKKQGWVALVGYTFTNKAFTDMLFAKLSVLKAMANKQEKSWHRTPIDNLFGDNQLHTLKFRQSIVEDWVSFFGAACAVIEAPERTDREFVAFEAINREVFDAFAVAGKIQIEYETTVSFGLPG